MLREIVRFAVPGCALAAAIWMLARYFAVLRPRAGTTEWIGRLTPPPWQPVSGCPLHGMDAPAALLLCLAVTGLRLLEHRLRFHAMPVTPEALLPVLFAGLAAGCAHLLLRRLLGGMLPALSGALFFGLLQDGSPAVTAALLGYVLWRTAKRRGGGWIVLSVVCFAAGLLEEQALLLLLPLYLIGYVCTRLSRRTGLGRSLALTLPLSLLGALGVAVLGWWMAGRGTPLEALRSFRFYEALWPALCGNVRAAVTLPGRFSPSELALGALAVLTLPELLHGLLPRARPSLRNDPAAARLRCGAVGPLRPVPAAAAAGHGPRVGLAEAVRPRRGRLCGGPGRRAGAVRRLFHTFYVLIQEVIL